MPFLTAHDRLTTVMLVYSKIIPFCTFAGIFVLIKTMLLVRRQQGKVLWWSLLAWNGALLAELVDLFFSTATIDGISGIIYFLGLAPPIWLFWATIAFIMTLFERLFWPGLEPTLKLTPMPRTLRAWVFASLAITISPLIAVPLLMLYW